MSVSRRHFLAAAGLTATAGAVPADTTRELPRQKFTLGLVTYNVARSWDLKTILEVCQKVGLAGVEFRTTHRHGVEPTLSKDQRKQIARMYKDGGVKIWGCGTACEFHSPQQDRVRENIETCKKFVDLVADLGGTGVKVRPNGLPQGVAVEKTVEQIGRALAECGKAAATAGVEIQLEVHGPGTSQPANIAAIMRACQHPSVGVTWNSNATDIKNGSVKEAFNLLWPWIKNCHINSLYNDALGKYPYRELFRLLREKGYERMTMIEVGQDFVEKGAGLEFLQHYKALWTELCRG